MKDPIKDPNFVRYLLYFGIGLMIIWIFFNTFILHFLPESLAFPLNVLGLGVAAVVWALYILNRYEKNYPDDD